MKTTIFALLSMACTLACAQSAGYIDPTMGFVNNIALSRDARDVKQLSNGHIVMCGGLYSTPENDGLFLNFDANGYITGLSQDPNVETFFACDTINASEAIAVGRGSGNNASLVFGKLTPGTYTNTTVNFVFQFQTLDVFDIATQRDGKFVICGYASVNGSVIRFWVARFNSDFTLDTSFGTNGHVLLSFGNNSQARALALQADGKIVVVGHSVDQKQSVVVRLTSSGQPDNSFFGTGYTLSASASSYNELYSVAVGQNQTIYAAGMANNGSSKVQLNVLTSSTRQDYLFTSGDKWYSLALEKDSAKVIVAGQSTGDFLFGSTVPVVYRYRFNGTAYVQDSSFNGFGNRGAYGTGQASGTIKDLAMGSCLQSDGKVLLCGTFNNQMFLTRLNGDPLSTGINQAHAAEIPVIIGPNPTSDRFYVYSSQAVKCLSVTDMSGREIPYAILGDNSYSLSGKGIYLVRIETEKGQILTKRVVVE